eukprot:1691463-Prymnesium_polylepis.1
MNVGLPRTGTTSFTAAAQRLHVNVMHIWWGWDNNATTWSRFLRGDALLLPAARRAHRCAVNETSTASSPCVSNKDLRIGPYDPKTLAWKTFAELVGHGRILALSDTPFYTDRLSMSKAYPDARFVCTTRSRETWIASMISFGEAGGRWLADRKNLTRHFPYDQHWRGSPKGGGNGKARQQLVHALGTAFDRHHATECAGLPLLSLDEKNDTVLWANMCGVLPTPKSALERIVGASPFHYAQGCAQLVATGAPWPRANGKPQASSLLTDVQALWRGRGAV